MEQKLLVASDLDSKDFKAIEKILDTIVDDLTKNGDSVRFIIGSLVKFDKTIHHYASSKSINSSIIIEEDKDDIFAKAKMCKLADRLIIFTDNDYKKCETKFSNRIENFIHFMFGRNILPQIINISKAFNVN